MRSCDFLLSRTFVYLCLSSSFLLLLALCYSVFYLLLYFECKLFNLAHTKWRQSQPTGKEDPQGDMLDRGIKRQRESREWLQEQCSIYPKCCHISKRGLVSDVCFKVNSFHHRNLQESDPSLTQESLA